MREALNNALNILINELDLGMTTGKELETVFQIASDFCENLMNMIEIWNNMNRGNEIFQEIIKHKKIFQSGQKDYENDQQEQHKHESEETGKIETSLTTSNAKDSSRFQSTLTEKITYDQNEEYDNEREMSSLSTVTSRFESTSTELTQTETEKEHDENQTLTNVTHIDQDQFRPEVGFMSSPSIPKTSLSTGTSRIESTPENVTRIGLFKEPAENQPQTRKDSAASNLQSEPSIFRLSS